MAETSNNLTLTYFRRSDDDELTQRPLSLSLIFRTLGYARPYARKRNLLFIACFIRACQLPALGWLISYIINGPIAQKDARGLVIATIGYAVLALWTCMHFHFRSRWALELGEAIVHDLRRDIFTHLQSLTMGYFHRTKLGRTISRMTSDAEAVRTGVQDVMFISFVQIVQMGVAAALILLTDWVMFSVMIFTAPLLFWFNRYFRSRLSRALRIVQESMSRVTATIAESVNGIRVTQGFVREDVNAVVFHRLVEEHAERNMDVARLSGALSPLLDVNVQIFTALMLLVGGWRVMHGQAPPEMLVQLFFLAMYFFEPIVVLGTLYNQALTSMAGAERVFQFLDIKSDFLDPPQAIKLQPVRGHVQFQNLDFEYRKNVPVLKDVTFEALPGQTVALVGHTGSGKTSIINLIAKFYIPTAGQLLIDGVDITRLDSEVLHRQTGIVLQVNFLFTGTVMENIRVGRASATDDDVRSAAKSLGVIDLIESLPQGFATVVGERGAGLSLGQRQIICFCRAMLANPRIFILDEATSSVDTITEARLQVALRLLLRGRTCFVVAHRLSTIRHADQVLVLEHGRIVERGNHNQLIAQGGVYANLYRQFVKTSSA